MKKSNELRKFVIFQLNECDAVKEYLEEMALKGWKLKYIRTFFCFEKIEPQTLSYSVEVFSKASVYDTIPANNTHEYIDSCRQAGWAFICTFGQVNIFVSDTENTLPIETDEHLKFRTIRRGVLKQNAMLWFVVFPLFLYIMASSISDFESLVTMNLWLMNCFLYLIFIAVVIIQVVCFIVWTVKQNRRLKQGEPIQYISKRARRMRFSIQLFPLGMMIVVLLTVATYSLVQKDFFTALTSGFLLLLIPAIFLLTNFLQKQGFSRTGNIVISVLFGLGISSILIISMVMLIFSPKADPHIDGASDSSATFLASSTTYYSTLEDGSEVSVTVFKSNYEFIIDRYLYSKTHGFAPTEYTEVTQPEWGAKSVYYSYSSFDIYVEYDQCVLTVFSESELDHADIDAIKAFMGK